MREKYTISKIRKLSKVILFSIKIDVKSKVIMFPVSNYEEFYLCSHDAPIKTKILSYVAILVKRYKFILQLEIN